MQGFIDIEIRKFGRLIKAAALCCIISVISTACDSIDDDRIPVMPVYVPFVNQAVWQQTLVNPAPLGHWNFIKEQRIPSNYSYSEISATGFGGILLVIDFVDQPVAYDLSCPYEAKRDIRIVVDEESNMAECPKCHSKYFIYENYGQPESGPAADRKYGLRRYTVTQPTGVGTEYRSIRN